MKISIKDYREECQYLGFIVVEDDDRYLHASVNIYDNNVFLNNFLSGRIGKYRFQADRDWNDDNGSLFKGAGRGKKPDSVWADMKNFVHLIWNMDIILDDAHKVKTDTYEYTIR